MPDERYAHFKDFSSAPLSLEEKKKVWLEISDMTEEEFDQMLKEEHARHAFVPDVGIEAPDFEIERLTPERKRIGEYVRLSSLRGRPVALAFGSYT